MPLTWPTAHRPPPNSSTLELFVPEELEESLAV